MKRKILWVTRMAPADIDSAGLILQYRYLEILSKEYDITVLSFKEDYGVNPLKKLNIEAIKYQGNEHFLEILQNNFDVAIFSWWDIANSFLQKTRPYVKKILINTIDVEFVRKERKLSVNSSTIEEKKDVYSRKDKEIQTYSWADKLWFVTQQDAEFIKKELPGINYDVFPIIQKLVPTKMSEKNPNYIYFIGNFLHSPNVDAAIRLCRDIFPKVLEKKPNLHLWIFGKWPPKELQEFNSNDHIHVTGIVYDLPKHLKQMSICLANLNWGAGLKGKVCEAMSNGIPVIGSSIAFEGLDINIEMGNDKQNAVLANYDDDFIDSIIKLSDDVELQKTIIRNAYELMKSFTNYNARLSNSIEEMFR